MTNGSTDLHNNKRCWN